MKHVYSILVVLVCFLGACKETQDNQDPNPYNNPDNDVYKGVDGPTSNPDPNSIAGLHKNIFKPTCANSGCHDGNFEPDFRSITSTYNTLVNQEVIKNDELNPFTARVTPGNDQTSMLLKRLLEDLNGNSGIMPLVTEPGSDWKVKKDEYIQNIKNWINDGAKDMSGKAPGELDFPPQLQGMVAYKNGVLFQRSGVYAPIQIPAGTGTIEIWFSFADDRTATASLSGIKTNYSLEANNFDIQKELDLQYSSTPVTEKGYYKTDVPFYHKISINTSQLGVAGDVLWFRTKVGDGVNPDMELPNNNSLFNAKKYFAIQLK